MPNPDRKTLYEFDSEKFNASDAQKLVLNACDMHLHRALWHIHVAATKRKREVSMTSLLKKEHVRKELIKRGFKINGNLVKW